MASSVETSKKIVALNLTTMKLRELTTSSLDEIEQSGVFEDYPACSWRFSVEAAEELEFEEEEEDEQEVTLFSVQLVVSYPSASGSADSGRVVVSTLVFEMEEEEEEEVSEEEEEEGREEEEGEEYE